MSRLLTRGQGGHEEAGVETAVHSLRRDPPRPPQQPTQIEHEVFGLKPGLPVPLLAAVHQPPPSLPKGRGGHLLSEEVLLAAASRQQHAGLLEGLPHRSHVERQGQPLVHLQPPPRCARVQAAPAAGVEVGVRLVDLAAREDVGAPHEVQGGMPLQHEHLRLAVAVA